LLLAKDCLNGRQAGGDDKDRKSKVNQDNGDHDHRGTPEKTVRHSLMSISNFFKFCYDENMDNWKKWLISLLIIGLLLIQSSGTKIDWLLLAAAWWGWQESWSAIFGLGLALDLISGNRLGEASLRYLLVGGGVYWLGQALKWHLMRKEIHLKLD
jgi:hypothetical protein